MLYIRYREGGERIKRTTILSSYIPALIDKLAAAPTIREFYVGETLLKHHKSFGADFDPSRLVDAAEALMGNRKDGASQQILATPLDHGGEG
jgi:hypothetical protein